LPEGKLDADPQNEPGNDAPNINEILQDEETQGYFIWPPREGVSGPTLVLCASLGRFEAPPGRDSRFP
jgi:hypothetical protein